VQQGVREQQRCDQHLGDPGPDQHLAAIHVIRQRAAVQAEDDEWRDRHQAHRADREVRSGQLVQLERQRYITDHATEHEHRARDHQDPEVAGATPGGQIDTEPGQPNAQGVATTGTW